MGRRSEPIIETQPREIIRGGVWLVIYFDGEERQKRNKRMTIKWDKGLLNTTPIGPSRNQFVSKLNRLSAAQAPEHNLKPRSDILHLRASVQSIFSVVSCYIEEWRNIYLFIEIYIRLLMWCQDQDYCVSVS